MQHCAPVVQLPPEGRHDGALSLPEPLDVLATVQLPPLQIICNVVQSLHFSPPDPHAVGPEPPWHTLVESQHPEQVVVPHPPTPLELPPELLLELETAAPLLPPLPPLLPFASPPFDEEPPLDEPDDDPLDVRPELAPPPVASGLGASAEAPSVPFPLIVQSLSRAGQPASTTGSARTTTTSEDERKGSKNSVTASASSSTVLMMLLEARPVHR